MQKFWVMRRVVWSAMFSRIFHKAEAGEAIQVYASLIDMLLCLFVCSAADNNDADDDVIGSSLPNKVECTLFSHFR